jgi:hypothetical protein
MTPQRPVFVLQLRPEPRVDAIRALRQALKTLLRRHGLRCLSVEKIPSAGERHEAVP